MTLTTSFTGATSLDEVLQLNDGSFSVTFYDGEDNEVYIEMDRETATGLWVKLAAIFDSEEAEFVKTFNAMVGPENVGEVKLP